MIAIQEALGVRVGDTIGRWRVLAIGWTKAKKRRRVALCRCTCPDRTEKVVALSSLAAGISRSCGCILRENPPRQVMIDGYSMSQHPLYRLHGNMLQRCTNPNFSGYAKNGKIGIRVYPEWRDDPQAFIHWVIKNLGPRPGRAQLVRIDPAKNWEPGNLRWNAGQWQEAS